MNLDLSVYTFLRISGKKWEYQGRIRDITEYWGSRWAGRNMLIECYIIFKLFSESFFHPEKAQNLRVLLIKNSDDESQDLNS